ncbi:MAG: YjbE family putative metal transport protein [Hyphomicrobiales bacterium]
MDFLWQDITHAPFWIAALQIIGVNIILSGDNAVVIAMACMTLPPRQRMWGMILGAGVAVLLRVVFTLVIAQAMTYPYLKLVGGLLLFWVAVKLVTEDADGEGGVEGGETLWRAVRIVAIADIVMSLDNVIAIAASAEMAAARVDIAHADAIKATLIIFGLATSVPLIVAGSAILMALLERFRVLIWAGGALLGWVAGDIMSTDPAVAGWAGPAVLHQLHDWGGRIGALLVVGLGYMMVRKHRALKLDEILAGVGLVIWIAADIIIDNMFGGATPDLVKLWSSRGVVFVALLIGYMMVRGQSAKKA